MWSDLFPHAFSWAAAFSMVLGHGSGGFKVSGSTMARAYSQTMEQKGQNCQFWSVPVGCLHVLREVGLHQKPRPYLHGAGIAGNSSELELLEIMERSGETPTTTYLGVSPPVRSGCYGGAANPWSHDRSWKTSAYSASHTNLEALRELDLEGESFLKCETCAAPDLALGSSPQTASASTHASLESSDAGSDPPSTTECTPFTCHTAYFNV